ncbi:hypothetical protein KSP40_PGU005752 [Platanthera guangdongensis]|uniref:Uncharacterized protein n=1 Tax=Platanthera guangdongensis TaxID=2320717 RepID=A0ABR2LWA4_9ASPA
MWGGPGDRHNKDVALGLDKGDVNQFRIGEVAVEEVSHRGMQLNNEGICWEREARCAAALFEDGVGPDSVRVEHIIREENMMAAQEIIELFCELIAVRLPIIEIQRECPLDLKEAISTICFAAPRCSDLPELQQVQMSFAAKYGKEFITAATELMPDCGVNRQIIELLSVRTPSVDTKLKLLKEIAEEHAVDWDPASTETEFLKPHEDLLNGPNHISTSPTMSLPEERHFASSSNNTQEEEEEKHKPNSDSDPYSWDLPEVPKGSLQANSGSPPPAVHLHPPPPPPFYSELKQEQMRNIPFIPPAYESENPTSLLTPTENKQFIPFASPPSDSIYAKPTESEATIDFQDVLAAAQAAAETAERAAAAARAAARLAQVRITELSVKKKANDSHGSDNEMNEGENPIWNQRNPVAPSWDSGSPPLSSRGPPEMAAHSPDSAESFSDERKPQRSTSIEDDSYFSYPNLFSRQDSTHK